MRALRRAACALARLSAAVAARADGYNGKTIALSLENYHAEARRGAAALPATPLPRTQDAEECLAPRQVTLTPAQRISFEPHPLHDPQDFADLGALAGTRLRAFFRRGQPRGVACMP